jgi:hypothetical protein
MAVPVPDPVFNILPVDFPEVDHAGMLFPEVRCSLPESRASLEILHWLPSLELN